MLLLLYILLNENKIELFDIIIKMNKINNNIKIYYVKII